MPIFPVAADLVINSLRRSSQKQYASYLKRFFDFLNGKPLHACNEKDLINYIEHLYSSGLGYSACNTARLLCLPCLILFLKRLLAKIAICLDY